MAEVEAVQTGETFLISLTVGPPEARYECLVVTVVSDGENIWYDDARPFLSLAGAGHWAEAELWSFLTTGLMGLHAFRESQPNPLTI